MEKMSEIQQQWAGKGAVPSLPYLLTEGQVLLWSSFFVLVPGLFHFSLHINRIWTLKVTIWSMRSWDTIFPTVLVCQDKTIDLGRVWACHCTAKTSPLCSSEMAQQERQTYMCTHKYNQNFISREKVRFHPWSKEKRTTSPMSYVELV